MRSWRPSTVLIHLLRNGALLTVCSTAFATAQAQSFDCTLASTPVEHAICDDASLGRQDQALARAVKSVLDAEPERRGDLLAEQRRWLAYRDERCADASTRRSCLSAAYRARIEHLHSRLSPSAALCHRIAEHYRPNADAHGQSALDALISASPPVFERSERLRSFDTPATELPEWAQAKSPPFVILPELTNALKEINQGTIGHLHHLPGTNLYAITHEQGSANCYMSQFFEVEDGYARPVKTPPLIEDEAGTACAVSRRYGRIDGVPVLIQRSGGSGPSLSSTEILVAWDDTTTPSACTMTSWYSPRFGKATAPNTNDRCDGSMCEDLRTAALELVEAVQKSARGTYERLHGALTRAQRIQFDADVDRTIASRRLRPTARKPTDWNPDHMTIDAPGAPLFVPYLHRGQVYVVSIGHVASYGTTLSDWRVEFEAFSNGERVQFAAFGVGMEKGTLKDTAVR